MRTLAKYCTSFHKPRTTFFCNSWWRLLYHRYSSFSPEISTINEVCWFFGSQLALRRAENSHHYAVARPVLDCISYWVQIQNLHARVTTWHSLIRLPSVLRRYDFLTLYPDWLRLWHLDRLTSISCLAGTFLRSAVVIHFFQACQLVRSGHSISMGNETEWFDRFERCLVMASSTNAINDATTPRLINPILCNIWTRIDVH